MLTVFTPTYNRADMIHKCYESLKRQHNKDFIWMIIDDGSTDNTHLLIEEWKKRENGFEIEYYYKNNGGLHSAYNEAIAHANTELMVCIDSDDYMPDDAVELIINFWSRYGNKSVAGIAALDMYENGEIIGDNFPEIKTINLIALMAGKYRIKNGDRKLVVRTDLYKSVAPMPSFNGEKNFNPHYMHLQISEKYDFLVMNKPLCVVEYHDEGMSRNILKQYYNSPNSFAQSRILYLSFRDVPPKFLFRHSIHYVSSCMLAKRRNIIKDSPRRLYTIIAYPFGVLLSCYIRRKCR